MIHVSRKIGQNGGRIDKGHWDHGKQEFQTSLRDSTSRILRSVAESPPTGQYLHGEMFILDVDVC